MASHGQDHIDADSNDATNAQLNAMATEDLLAALDCEVVDVIDDDEIQRGSSGGDCLAAGSPDRQTTARECRAKVMRGAFSPLIGSQPWGDC